MVLDEMGSGMGGHRYFRTFRPLLSHSCPGGVRGGADQMRATRTRGQPLVRASTPDTWTRPGRAPVLQQFSK